MLTFKYTAKDKATGERVHAEIQAESEQAAAKAISQQGMSPLEVSPAHFGGGFSRFRNRVKTKDKVLFSRQLSTLINSGLPLIQSLRTVLGQTRSRRFQSALGSIIGAVESGSTLSAAMAKYPEHFNKIYISLIAAGEASGTLDKSLERLANQQEKDADIVSKVRGALVYPVIVLVVMFAVVTFMIVKVLPQVQQLYRDIPGANLPLITEVLLAVAGFVNRFWWAIILAVVLAAFFGSRWARTLGGEQVIDKIKMKAPLVGPLYMKMYMARFGRTSATLLSSGVPLIQILEITAQSINNVHIEKSLLNSAEKVKTGKALSETLANNPNFLQLVPDMIKIGEQSGSLETMMVKVADYYEKEVDNQIKAISTTIEPILMVVLGVFAFIVVAAILLPIYGLAGQTLIR